MCVCSGSYSFVSASYSLKPVPETEVEARTPFSYEAFMISEEPGGGAGFDPPPSARRSQAMDDHPPLGGSMRSTK